MLYHLPALQIVIPLLAAPLCLLLRSRVAAWAVAWSVSWLAFLVAASLLEQVLSEGVLSYALGGWAAPWGIEYKIDGLNGLVLVIVTGIGALVMGFSHTSANAEIPSDRIVLFYTLYLLWLTGTLGIVITGDVFNVFVFLEISSLSSYALIALGRDRRALLAAYQYLIMGTVGATFFLIGVGLLYMMTGTLNMADLAQRLPRVAETRTVFAAVAFIVVGLGLKIALFPLHLWLPNAYTYAPSVASALLAGTATKVALYVLVRMLFTVFGESFSFEGMSLGRVLLPLALLAAVVGSVIAIYQTSLKGLLAYSSVAQIGYMALGVSLASTTGLIATIVHMFNHALMKGALFLVAGCLFARLGSVKIDDFAGLGRRMPWTFAAFVVAGLSLIGVPLTAGFISKWYLISGALEQGMWPVAIIVLGTSLLAVIYIWRVVETAYFRAPRQDIPATVSDPPLTMLVPVWILVGANIYFGVDTSLTVGVAEQAAAAAFGGTR